MKHVSEPLSKKQKITRHLIIQPKKDLLKLLLTSNSLTDKEIEEVLKSLLKLWDG